MVPRWDARGLREGSEDAREACIVRRPGMLPNALPGMSNLWLIPVKDTALISVIGFEELFFTAQPPRTQRQLYVPDAGGVSDVNLQ